MLSNRLNLPPLQPGFESIGEQLAAELMEMRADQLKDDQAKGVSLGSAPKPGRLSAPGAVLDIFGGTKLDSQNSLASLAEDTENTARRCRLTSG